MGGVVRVAAGTNWSAIGVAVGLVGCVLVCAGAVMGEPGMEGGVGSTGTVGMNPYVASDRV